MSEAETANPHPPEGSGIDEQATEPPNTAADSDQAQQCQPSQHPDGETGAARNSVSSEQKSTPINLPSIQTIDGRPPQTQPPTQQTQAPIGSPLPSHMPPMLPMGQYVPGYAPPMGTPSNSQMRYQISGDPGKMLPGSRHKKEVKRRTKTGCLTCRKRRIKVRHLRLGADAETRLISTLRACRLASCNTLKKLPSAHDSPAISPLVYLLLSQHLHILVTDKRLVPCLV